MAQSSDPSWSSALAQQLSADREGRELGGGKLASLTRRGGPGSVGLRVTVHIADFSTCLDVAVSVTQDRGERGTEIPHAQTHTHLTRRESLRRVRETPAA